MRTLTYRDLKRQIQGLAQSENSDEVTITERKRQRSVLIQVLAELNLRETVSEDYVTQCKEHHDTVDILRNVLQILDGHNVDHSHWEHTAEIARALVARYA